MKDFLKDCFTTKDGETGDLGRVLWAASFVVFSAVVLGKIFILRHDIGLMDLASGLAAVTLGHSASLLLKSSTEPDK